MASVVKSPPELGSSVVKEAGAMPDVGSRSWNWPCALTTAMRGVDSTRLGRKPASAAPPVIWFVENNGQGLGGEGEEV